MFAGILCIYQMRQMLKNQASHNKNVRPVAAHAVVCVYVAHIHTTLRSL